MADGSALPTAEPRRCDSLAERVDGPGNLPARYGGEVGEGEGPYRAAGSQGRVDEVDSGRRHSDPHLSGARLGIVDLLVAEVLGGPEGVEPDGVPG